jgi:ComF family protein
MSLAAAVLDAFFPPYCPGCGGESGPVFCDACLAGIAVPPEPLCASCGLSLEPSPLSDRCRACLDRPPAFRRARACAVYDAGDRRGSPLRAAVHRYKYERDLAEAPALSALLAARCPLDLGQYDVLVPVPLHLSRLRWRGFNQAQILVAPLARAAGLLCDPFSLERVRPTDPQVRLDPEARRRNVHGAFRVTRGERIRDRRVLLFDDVFTSGATVDACARELLRSRARSVDVLTLAHAVVP